MSQRRFAFPGRLAAGRWALVALGLPLALAACVVPPKPAPLAKYVAPTTGPTAKLVMRGSVPAGDLYGVSVFDDSEHCTGSRIVGAGGNARSPASTTLAANRVTTLEFLLIKPNKQYCSVRWTFTPLAGKTYLLRGAALPTTCGAAVLDMTNPEDIKPEQTALRRNPTGFACLPISQSKAASLGGSDKGSNGNDAVLRPGAGADDLQGLIAQ